VTASATSGAVCDRPVSDWSLCDSAGCQLVCV